jgi:ribosomal protein L37AE/L43A
MEERHICINCRKKTENFQRVNGGSWYCYDGCYSTTGTDRRTVDGSPGWLHNWKNLKEEFKGIEFP